MGAFDVVPPITIPDPEGGKASKAFCEKHGDNATAEQEFRDKWRWEPHEQIIIKGQFSTVDQEIMENAASALKGKGNKKTVEMRSGTARRKMLEVMIIDWTLTQNGRKMAVTPQSIGMLPTNYRTPVLEMCDEIAKAIRALKSQKDAR